MGFFDKLKAAFSGSTAATTPSPADRGPGWRSLITPVGVSSPTCPYCGHAFEKMPQRKRSCPSCAGVFYSRKRAIDGAKVLLKESEVPVLEAQDSLVALAQDGTTAGDLDQAVRALQGQLGRAPSPDEVVADHLIRAAAGHAESWSWGLYRNARFGLAEVRARQGRLEEALRFLLEVSILDLNGAHNCGTKDPAVTRDFPPFNPKAASLAPGIVARTAEVIASLELPDVEARRLFESVAGTVGPAFRLPRSPDAVWRELSKALREQA